MKRNFFLSALILSTVVLSVFFSVPHTIYAASLSRGAVLGALTVHPSKYGSGLTQEARLKLNTNSQLVHILVAIVQQQQQVQEVTIQML